MLLGREQERLAIENALVGTRSGGSTVIALVGEPGIGKTALLDHAAERAAGTTGMRLLRARGIESEAHVPFGSLLELLRPALILLEKVPEPQAVALGGALALRPAPAQERFAIGAATLSLLAAYAEQGPVAVLIDDAQWLDESSAQALLFAFRRLVADPIAVFLAVREGAPSLIDGSDLPTLHLGGLSSDEAAALLRGLPAETALRLHGATAGNPLAMLELAPDFRDLALAPEGAPVLVSTRISRAFLQRAGSLDEAARRALVLAATSDSGDLPTLERAAARLGIDLEALAVAESAGLVTLHAGAVEFRHPLARSAIYADAPAGQRRDAHRALAAALPDRDVDRRAWHLAAAVIGTDDSASAALEQAGARSRDRSAYATAAAAFERAGQLAADPERRGRLLWEAGDAAWLAGLPERAVTLLDQARTATGDPGRLAEIDQLAGLIATSRGPVMRGHAILTAAAGRADPERAVAMLAEAAFACFLAGNPAEMLRVAERARALLPRGAPVRARFLAAIAVGMARIIGGDAAAGAEAVHEAVTLAESSPDLREDLRLMPWLTLGPLFLRQTGAGRWMLEHALRTARDRAAVGALPLVLILIARDQSATDRWAVAGATYREAIDLARESGQQTALAFGLAGLAWLQARRGRELDCRADAAEALRLSDELGTRLCEVWATAALGELELSLGDAARAAECFERQQQLLLDLGITDADLSPAAELVDAYARLGRDDDARQAADRFLAVARAKGQPWSLARALRGQGTLAAGSGFAALFEQALSQHEQTPDAFETARTRLAYGERLRRARDRILAREQLRAAADAFEDLDARPWADRARAELAATGETLRRRDSSTLEELTPQELQIALLLTAGKTTRETAAALFLSPKTVEYHLRHVYQKLGIHSREELAQALAQSSPGAAGRAGPRLPVRLLAAPGRREQPTHPGAGRGDPVDLERAGVDALPDRLLGGAEQRQQVAVVGPGQEAAPVRRQPADHDAGAGAVPAMLHRIGLDGGPAVGLPGLRDRGPAVDFGLQVAAVVRAPGGGCGGVDADGVLAHDAAVGADESVAAGVCAGPLGDLGDRVHGVVVAGAAEERQPAGDGKPAGIVGPQAEAVAEVEHRGGEAAVQVDGGQVVGVDAGHLQGMAGGQHRGRAGRQVGAVEQVAFGQVGVAAQEDPPVGRDAQPPRGGGRGQQGGGTLVDLLPGDDVPRVGVGDRAVRLARGHQFGGAAHDRRRSVRVARRNLGERGEQRAHRRRVLVAGLVEPGPARVLDQRVLARRAGQAVCSLVRGEQAVQAVTPVLKAAAGPLAEIGPVVGRGVPLRGGNGLRSEDQRHLAAAGGDGRGQLVDQVLRRLAAGDLQDRAGRSGTDPARDRPGVVVGPAERRPGGRVGDLELADARDRVDRRGQGGRVRPRVGERGPRGVGGQVNRRAAPVPGLVQALGHLAGADQHGRARVHPDIFPPRRRGFQDGSCRCAPSEGRTSGGDARSAAARPARLRGPVPGHDRTSRARRPDYPCPDQRPDYPRGSTSRLPCAISRVEAFMATTATSMMRQTMDGQAAALAAIAEDPAPIPAVADRLRGRRVLVIGTGTSWHAANQAAALLRAAGLDVAAEQSVDAATDGPLPGAGGVLLALTHTGAKRYTAQAVARARAQGADVIQISGTAVTDADLHTVERERSSAYTASHLGALMRVAQLAQALGADLPGLAAVPAAVDRVHRDANDGQPLAPPPGRLIEYIGGGINQWTAAEGALKIREAAYVASEGLGVEQFLHGPSVALGRQDRLVSLDGGGAWSERIAEVTLAAEESGTPVTRITHRELGELLSIFPLTVAVQRIALEAAEILGTNPDSFGRDVPGRDAWKRVEL